jgi:hypothetical protein
MKTTYRESEVPGLVASLTGRFEDACLIYKLALESRSSNRSKKELSRGNSRGTVLHKFQSNFCWLIYDIQKGPRFFIDDRVSEVEELIAHIISISNS